MGFCVFCDIVSGHLPCYKVYEDDLVLAFLDIKPLTNGHTLIIPKEHFPDIASTPDGELMHISKVTKDLVLKYRRMLYPDGFNIRQSNGRVAHQEVLHYHTHLVPRYNDDDLALISFDQAPNINPLEDTYAKLITE